MLFANVYRHRASLSGFPGGRSNVPPSSASSWQGLVVVPGGAPMPPECSSRVHEPAGVAPRPAIKTPHEPRPSTNEVLRSLSSIRKVGIRSRDGN